MNYDERLQQLEKKEQEINDKLAEMKKMFDQLNSKQEEIVKQKQQVERVSNALNIIDEIELVIKNVDPNEDEIVMMLVSNLEKLYDQLGFDIKELLDRNKKKDEPIKQDTSKGYTEVKVSQPKRDIIKTQDKAEKNLTIIQKSTQ